MADWTAIETALAAWVTARTGLECVWAHRPTGWHSPQGYCLLSHAGRRTVGNDELQQDYDATAPAGEEITTAQVGQRQFTLGVQVRTWRTSGGADAKHYTSLIRDAVCLPTLSDAVFKAVDLAFARILSETDLLSQQDGREMSVAQLDLRFNATALTADTPTGYIATLDDFRLEVPSGTLRWTGDIAIGP